MQGFARPYGCLCALLVALLVGCGGDDAALDPSVDHDGDGVSINQGDCDDVNATVYPGAPEPCDGIDQDCDNSIDEDYDQDHDGFTTCGGDCADNDPNSNPVQAEVIDGLDNNCDGIADNNTDQYDDDEDGFSEDQGDCDDSTKLIGPGAIEVATNDDGSAEGLDNDCDGIVDEALEPCSTARDLAQGISYADALDVCYGVASAGWTSGLGIDSRSRTIKASFGDVYGAQFGPDMVVLSTGLALDEGDAGWEDPVLGTEFTSEIPHPEPQGDPQDGCGVADPSTVNDYTEIKLVLNVPANANGFSFDFNFMSAEFPDFVCSDYDDTFLAILDSNAYQGNVSFDELGNRVSINIGFFDVCQSFLGPNCMGQGDLAGTGFTGHGGTGWLTTTAPLQGGEKATLTFMIFDEGDHVYDSLVLIDNFRWEFAEVDAPSTVERKPRVELPEPVAPTHTELNP